MNPCGFDKKLLFVFVLLLCLCTAHANARDNIRVHLDGTFLSRFVWRGEMWTDDPVFWQTTTIRYKGFRSYNFFNVDLTDINNDKFECNEYDFIIDYKGLSAYATAHHCQFVGYAGRLAELAQWSIKAMPNEKTWDKAIDEAGLLRLTTIDRVTRHIGNILDDELKIQPLNIEEMVMA